MTGLTKCDWPLDGGMMEKYHDEEWGIPLHDDRKQFEFLIMEAMQCGLSWAIVMKKREILRKCFDDFDFYRIAEYDDNRLDEIMETHGMLHSMPKIKAVVNNAKKFIEIIDEWGSFDKYIWHFTDGKTMVYRANQFIMPPQNELSETIAKDIKRRGFKYLGPVTIYSYLQAAGIINDHQEKCFLYKHIIENYPCEFVD
ncbi:MAG: DNA-3-methyladenine glycosylase I [Clostridia bacterium]|nr:DNA-3-methyladenine glycosylase I [Clostridia bacterium]